MGEQTEFLRRRIAAKVPPGGKSFSQSPRQKWRGWFPCAVLISGVVLTLLAAYYAARSIQLRTRAQFETSALRARAAIRAHVEVFDAVLRGAGGFVAVEKEVTRARFKNYIARLDITENYPGVEAVGYAPRVPAPDKQNLAASMAEQGVKNFRIWPEGERADFFPVICVEPDNSQNGEVLGFDMFTEPTRREAMERARDTSNTAASGRVKLFESLNPDRQPGFLIYFPVYRDGVIPDTLPERRAKLQGFVFAVFRAGDLFTSIFADEGIGATVEVFDGTNTNDAHLLYRSREKSAGFLPFQQTLQEATTIDVSGRTWTTRFSAEPGKGMWIVLSLLGGGLALSLVMFYLTHAEGRALRAAELSTAQLKVSELALRESQESLRHYAIELEHRVAERTANLAQSIQSLEGVLYHVAHDLRAPLRTMSSFTYILLDEYAPQLDERGRDYAERVSNAAQRMDGLVQDLLAYGRLAHTAVPVSNIDLEAEVKSALGNFSDEIQAKHATVEIASPLPPVKANAAILNQILSNLISNALKFVKSDTKPLLRIRAEETISHPERAAAKTNGESLLEPRLPALDGKFIRLWVEDNGIGIKPEYHERIFRMFERLHNTDAYPGTGIGLAIVQKAVERMGGRVGVESAAGIGSRFWVELPAT